MRRRPASSCERHTGATSPHPGCRRLPWSRTRPMKRCSPETAPARRSKVASGCLPVPQWAKKSCDLLLSHVLAVTAPIQVIADAYVDSAALAILASRCGRQANLEGPNIVERFSARLLRSERSRGETGLALHAGIVRAPAEAGRTQQTACVTGGGKSLPRFVGHH